MKRFWLFFLLSVPFLLNAQQKGAAPVGSGASTAGMTRALVIGVSSYQDEGIPSLKYAHKDAEEFARFLQTQTGGSLRKDQIELITNEQATAANIYSKLDWLLEVTKENDQVIIYFSGHGDVETATSRSRGFLLAYDTPPTNYRIGALRVNDLNDILADLVEIKKSKVILIADACRSGNLAGGTEGATATASAVSEQYKNQVKIMSCRPNEFSLEGEQWGGGRGAFSYHLIDGLVGLADEDKNAEVDLFELDDYLRSKVTRETDRQQTPWLVGDQRALLSLVDANELIALMNKRADENMAFAAVHPKGMEEEILAKTDTIIQQLYEDFLVALDDQYFLPEDYNGTRKKGKSASELYDLLSKVEELLPMHANIKRNFAVALQDESQKSINAYLKAEPDEMKERWENFGAKYKSNPAYLGKAASLLGESHYLYDRLIAKKYYYEGLLLRLEGQKTKNDSLFNLALEKEKLALQYDGESAFIYNEIGLIYKTKYYAKMNDGQIPIVVDSLYDISIAMFEKAKAFAPKWVMPYINLANIYLHHGNFEESEAACLLALSLDSTQVSPKWYLGDIYSERKAYHDAIPLYKHIIKEKPVFNASVFNNLGYAYFKTNQYVLAEEMYYNAIKLDAGFSSAYSNLGELYYLSKDFEKSIAANLEWAKLDTINSLPFYNIACIVSIQGKEEEAVTWLEKAILKGFDSYNWIKNDDDLRNARNSMAYKELKKRYFPDK